MWTRQLTKRVRKFKMTVSLKRKDLWDSAPDMVEAMLADQFIKMAKKKLGVKVEKANLVYTVVDVPNTDSKKIIIRWEPHTGATRFVNFYELLPEITGADMTITYPDLKNAHPPRWRTVVAGKRDRIFVYSGWDPKEQCWIYKEGVKPEIEAKPANPNHMVKGVDGKLYELYSTPKNANGDILEKLKDNKVTQEEKIAVAKKNHNENYIMQVIKKLTEDGTMTIEQAKKSLGL